MDIYTVSIKNVVGELTASKANKHWYVTLNNTYRNVKDQSGKIKIIIVNRYCDFIYNLWNE